MKHVTNEKWLYFCEKYPWYWSIIRKTREFEASEGIATPRHSDSWIIFIAKVTAAVYFHKMPLCSAEKNDMTWEKARGNWWKGWVVSYMQEYAKEGEINGEKESNISANTGEAEVRYTPGRDCLQE